MNHAEGGQCRKVVLLLPMFMLRKTNTFTTNKSMYLQSWTLTLCGIFMYGMSAGWLDQIYRQDMVVGKQWMQLLKKQVTVFIVKLEVMCSCN